MSISRMKDKLRQGAQNTANKAKAAAQKQSQAPKSNPKSNPKANNKSTDTKRNGRPAAKTAAKKVAQKTGNAVKTGSATPAKRVGKQAARTVAKKPQMQKAAQTEKGMQRTIDQTRFVRDMAARSAVQERSIARNQFLPQKPSGVMDRLGLQKYYEKGREENNPSTPIGMVKTTLSDTALDRVLLNDELARKGYGLTGTSVPVQDILRASAGLAPLDLLTADSVSKAYFGRGAGVKSKQKEKTDKEKVLDAAAKVKEHVRQGGARQQTTSRYDNRLKQQYREEIKLAKEDFEAAQRRGDTAGMAEAHERAETWRRIGGGFSGGADGSQYITPEISEEDKKILNKEGIAKLSAAKLGYMNAETDEDRARYAAMGDAVRGNPEYWKDTFSRGAYRNTDAEGRMRYGGTKEEREKEREQLTAIPKAIGTSVAGSFLSIPGTRLRALQEDASNNQGFLQNLSDIRGGGEVNVSKPEKQKTPEEMLAALFQDERYQNASPALKAKKLARTLADIKEEIPLNQRLLKKSQHHYKVATEDLNALEKSLTEAIIAGGEMIPSIVATWLSGGAALPGLATMYTQVSSKEMANQEMMGKDPLESYYRGVTQGAAETIPEALPWLRMLRMAGGTGGKFGREMGKLITENVLSDETSNFLGNAANKYIFKDEDAKVFDKDEILNTAAVSTFMALGMGTGAGMLGSARKRNAAMDLTTPSMDQILEQEKAVQAEMDIWEKTNARLLEQAQNNTDDPTVHKHFLQELEQHQAQKEALTAKMTGIVMQKAQRALIDARKAQEAQADATQNQNENEQQPTQEPAQNPTQEQQNPLLDALRPKSDIKLPAARKQAPTPLNEAVNNESTQTEKPKAGLDWNDDYVKRISIKTAKEIDIVAKALGVPVRFEDLNAGKDPSKPWTFENGYYDKATGEVVISRDIEDPVKAIIGHEFTHRMQRLAPEEYKALKDYVMSLDEFSGREQQWIDDYEKAGKDLDVEKARDEIVADFAGTLIEREDLLRDFALNNSHNVSLLQRVKDFFTAIANKLTGKKKVQVQKAIRLLEQAMQASAQAEGTAVQTEQNKNAAQKSGAERQYAIKTDEQGRRYVQADRQVLHGDDPNVWGRQIEDFINEQIRKGEDVLLPTEDGHMLALTERSAYKMSDRHKPKKGGGARELLADDDYALKGRVAGHIDELIQVGSFDGYEPDIAGNHENDIGEDGFNYYESFFRDFDGTKYRIPISAGLNEEGETAYSIGIPRTRKGKSTAGRGPSSNGGAQNGSELPGAIIRTSEDKSQGKSAIELAFEKAQKEKDEKSQLQNSRQHSIRSSAQGAGFEAVKNEETGMIEFWRNGNKIEHVTPKMLEDEGAIGMMIKMARDHAKTISKRQAKKQLQGWADLLNLILKTQESELVWEFAGAELFSAVKANSDKQYKTTIDFGTICVKTQDMIDAMSDAMYQLGRGLNKDEITALQKKLKLNQATVPCPVCYVFSRWAGVGGLLDNMKKWHYKYLNMTDAEVQNAVRQLERAQTEGARESARNNKEYGEQYREMEAVAEDPNASEEDKKRAKREMKAIEKIMKRRALGENDEEFFQHMSEAEDLQNKINKISEDLRELKRTKKSQRENSMEIQLKEKTKAKFKERLKEHNDAMKEIEKSGGPELSWLKRVRTKPDYFERGVFRGEDGNLLDGRDFDKIIFDLNATKRWVEEAPLLWEYRKSRGAGLGKAILPYSDFRFGDLIQGDKNNSANGSTTWEKVGKNLTKTQEKNYKAARNRLLAQKWMGGQRFQSTSDFRYDYALDYLQAFLELQALGGSMQTYTKVLEFADMVTKIHGDANMSVMPLGRGYDENGKLMYSDLTGINAGEAIKLRNNSDSAQLILVGINDEHIRLAMQDSEDTGGIYVDFIIPYHPSGASIDQFIAQLVQNLDEEYNPGNYQNYEVVQNDIERDDITPEQSRRAELRRKLLTRTEKVGKKAKPWSPSEEDMDLINRRSKNIRGRDFKELFDIETRALNGDPNAIREYESWSAGVLNNIYQAFWANENSEYHGVNLTNDQADMLMPNEYWDTKTTRDTAYINGFIFRSLCHSLGLHPRFTGWSSSGRVDHGDFRDQEGYWKTLIDRRMYDRNGKYRKQEAVNITDISGQDQFDMLTPAYGQEHYGNVRTQQPDNEKALKASSEFVVEMQGEEEDGLRVSGSTASYTDERIDTVLKEYGGGGNYAQGFVTYIDPNDFLKLTLSDSSREKWEGALDKGTLPEEFFPLDAEKLRGNRQSPYLSVDTATGEVWGHEGRHRMLALARAGVTKAPVVLVDTATKYSKEPTAQMRLTSQDFGKGPVNDGYTVTVENLLPTNKQYRDQIKEAYGDENADVRFSIRGSGSYEQMHESIYGKKPRQPRTKQEQPRRTEQTGDRGYYPSRQERRKKNPPRQTEQAGEDPYSVGAAPSGFDQFSNWQNESDAFHPINPRAEAAEANNWGRAPVEIPVEDPFGKLTSKTASTFINAGMTPNQVSDELANLAASGRLSRVPYTDRDAIAKAEKTVRDKGYQRAKEMWKEDMERGRMGKDVTTMGITLYNAAANSGHVTEAIEIATDMIGYAKTVAQSLQAVNIINKLGPTGKLYSLTRSIEKLEDQIRKNKNLDPDHWDGITIPPDLAKEYMEAASPEEQRAIEVRIKKAIAQQIPNTLKDKLDAWRYMAMLGNPRTQIRNLAGNLGFQPVRIAKNMIGAGLERIAGIDPAERTKSVQAKAFSQEDRARYEAGLEDYDNVEQIIMGNGKFNDEFSDIDQYRTIFKFKPFEGWRKLTNAGLEKGDVFFAKRTYADSLAGILKARGITADQFRSPDFNQQQKEAIQAIAIEEAQKATYRDLNQFSNYISGLGKKRGTTTEKAVHYLTEGLLPFKKTPANILVRGLEYSPVGLIKGIRDMGTKVKSGDMTAAQGIDEIASGLTGTGLFALGITLALTGLVSPGDDEDEKQSKFNDLLGRQSYALNLPGGYSYTLDWMAPESIPFFMGVELQNAWNQIEEGTAGSDLLWNAVRRIADPVLEQSMLSGVNDLLENVSYADNKAASILSTLATGYLSQFVPTIGGQIERTLEDRRYSTWIDRDSKVPSEVQYLIGKNLSKIPGIDYHQREYLNAWGEPEMTGNPLTRALTNFLSPGYVKKESGGAVEAELQRLYDAGFTDVFPTIEKTSTKINDLPVTMEQFNLLQGTKGRTMKDLYTEAISSAAYQNLEDADKADLLGKLADYAKTKGKQAAGDTKEAPKWMQKMEQASEEYGVGVGALLQASMVLDTKYDADGNGYTKTEEAWDGIQDMAKNNGLSEKEQKALFAMYNGTQKTYEEYKAEADKKAEVQVNIDKYISTLPQEMQTSLMDACGGNLNSFTQAEAYDAILNMGGTYEQQKAAFDGIQAARGDNAWKEKGVPRTFDSFMKKAGKDAANKKETDAVWGDAPQEHIDTLRSAVTANEQSYHGFFKACEEAGIPRSEWPSAYKDTNIRRGSKAFNKSFEQAYTHVYGQKWTG